LSESVLDASAVLATLRQEPGADVVDAALAQGALVSAVNLAEVASKLVDLGLDDETIAQSLAELGLETRELSAEQGFDAGLMRCLALARSLHLPVLTTDTFWRDLDLGVEVRVIR
jgi:PIN domain nuclease of toxin-antitoxin system